MLDLTGQTYVDLPTLKSHLDLTGTEDVALIAADDTLLNIALESASRSVESATGGRVFTLDVTASPRTYAPDSDEDLAVDDIGALDGLLVETGFNGTYSTLDASAWEVSPLNALVKGRPITSITSLNYGYGWWPHSWHRHDRLFRNMRVRVTARWGWPAVPSQVVTATLLTAARLYRRKGSPEGVAGFNDMGVVRVVRLDPDVEAMLDNVRRQAIA